MADDGFPRRKFLLGAGVAGTAIAAGIAEPLEAQQPAPVASPAAVSSQEPEPFVTLTALQAAFIVAAVDTLIPADELSPSGSDCGVAIFIDRQLGSDIRGRLTRRGPRPESEKRRPGRAGSRLSVLRIS